MPRDAAASAKASLEVKGYQIQTDLDRKLLLGIWELDRKDASVEHYYDLSTQHVSPTPMERYYDLSSQIVSPLPNACVN